MPLRLTNHLATVDRVLNARPGAYMMIGNGVEGATVHHPMYDFNDEAIPAGCSWFAEVVETRLKAS